MGWRKVERGMDGRAGRRERYGRDERWERKRGETEKKRRDREKEMREIYREKYIERDAERGREGEVEKGDKWYYRSRL